MCAVRWQSLLKNCTQRINNMVELVDELVLLLEKRLVIKKIELTAQDLDEVRDVLDSVLIKHEEKINGIG